jgi:hypothetical protein
MKYLALIICLWNLALFAQPEGETEAPLQQQNVNTDEILKTKLGVKFTMGGHSFLGTAFDNARPLYGFGAGMYNIVDLNKNKTLKFQWEMNLTFKGSKFGKTNDTSFSKISYKFSILIILGRWYCRIILGEIFKRGKDCLGYIF